MKKQTIATIKRNLPAVIALALVFPLFQNCSKLSTSLSNPAEVTTNSPFSGDSYAPQSVAGSQAVSNGLVVLKEYRHKPLNIFFYTSRTSDQSALESPSLAHIFEVTGNTFTINAADSAGLSPLHRLFNSVDVYHYYTLDVNAKNNLLANPNWKYEGIEGYATLINPGSTCPTSPFVTYPVNRLYHPTSKYRLAVGAAQKQQLLVNGYIDQGVALCVRAVNSVIPDSESPPVIIPPTSQSCSINGINVAHGGSITAYQSASVGIGQSCLSQVRSCTNGTLDGSYSYTSCRAATAPVAPPAGVSCLAIPGFLRSNPISSTNTYRKVYSTSTLSDNSHDQYRLKGTNTIWTIPLVINASDSTAGSVLAQLAFGEAPASQRAGRKIVISRSSCDMSTGGSNLIIATQSNSGASQIAINDTTRATTVKNLTTGQYYINVQNTSCPTGQYCDALVEWLGVMPR